MTWPVRGSPVTCALRLGGVMVVYISSFWLPAPGQHMAPHLQWTMHWHASDQISPFIAVLKLQRRPSVWETPQIKLLQLGRIGFI